MAGHVNRRVSRLDSHTVTQACMADVDLGLQRGFRRECRLGEGKVAGAASGDENGWVHVWVQPEPEPERGEMMFRRTLAPAHHHTHMAISGLALGWLRRRIAHCWINGTLRRTHPPEPQTGTR